MYDFFQLDAINLFIFYNHLSLTLNYQELAFSVYFGI